MVLTLKDFPARLEAFIQQATDSSLSSTGMFIGMASAPGLRTW